SLRHFFAPIFLLLCKTAIVDFLWERGKINCDLRDCWGKMNCDLRRFICERSVDAFAASRRPMFSLSNGVVCRRHFEKVFFNST
ncbi:hypothetical protein, partial [Cloacibacillus evryensis]|uniref:hypothetical protein n=1 Tax=Cloacibacillus evryensis TaxID=508460 RepID=UPI0026DEABF1